MPGYLARTRSLVGAEPLLMPAAGVAIFDDQDRLLLLRHRHDGRWGTPGGGMEIGESPEAAARREVAEETGLQLPQLALVGAFGGPDFAVDYGDGVITSYVVVLYGCVAPIQDVRLQQAEVTESGRFTATEIDALDLQPDMAIMLPAAFGWLASRNS